MSSFESSLRSPPKSSVKKIKNGSVSSPLRQSFASQQSVDSSTLPAGLRAPPPLHQSPNSIWEPPLSCQRSPMAVLSDPNGHHEQLYFPVELTSGDYVCKVYRLIAALLVSICKNKSGVAVRDNAVSAKFDLFIGQFGVYSKLIADKNKIVLFNEFKSFAYEPHMDLLLDVHQREVSLMDTTDTNPAKLLSESGKLSDLTTFYTSARALVGGLMKTTNSTNNSDITACGGLVLRELDHLEQQNKLHRVFKDQRMVAMGWLWPTPASSPTGRLDTGGTNPAFSPTWDGGESKSSQHGQYGGFSNTSTGSNSAVVPGAPDVKRIEVAKQEAEEVNAQLRALLQPTTLATVQLFHRLVSIVQDLDVLMRALSADNEYQEAQRLRELKAVVDATITRQGRALLDQVRQCCTQAQLLAAELRHYCEDCKQRGAYYLAAQECEVVARDLNSQQRELRTNGVSPFSLLSQPSVVARLQAEGSSFVTSNFLFSEPHLQQTSRVASSVGGGGGGSVGGDGMSSPHSPIRQQNQVPHQTPLSGAHTAAGSTGTGLISIGSLVIRAGSNSVLHSIRSTWPGLTALNSTLSLNLNNTLMAGSTVGSVGAVGAAGLDAINGFNNSFSASTNAPFGSPSPSANPSNGGPSVGGPGVGAGSLLSAAQYNNINNSHNPLDPNHHNHNHHNQSSLSPIRAPLGHSTPYLPANNSVNNINMYNTLPLEPHSPMRQSGMIPSFPPDESAFNPNESYSPVGGFNTAEHYNQVGFSPTILTVLMSFEELQQQLRQLLSPASMALTALMQRLIGVSGDLLQLSQRNHHAAQYAEGDRVLALRAAVEATIDADIRDTATSELVCGRGRRRLDNLQVLMQQVQVGIRELQRLAIRSRAESDFTGAQALDAVSVELVQALSRVEKGLSGGVFSLLDSESGTPATEGGIEINELIAREGTSFLTSDYIFQFTSGREGHSIGSLAIVAGAGAVLRFIRAEWPGLTALSAPQYGQPQLPSHGEEGQSQGQWGSTSIGGGGGAGNVSGGASVNGSPPVNSNTGVMNFRDASSLRLLGFDAHSLRLAGFSDISIVTAGYTATELRDANFTTEQLRAAGLNESALRVVGYHVEQQSDVLASLFRATEGGKWTVSAGWRDLLRMRRTDLTTAHATTHSSFATHATTLAQQLQAQQSQSLVLRALEGVKCDETTGDVVRIALAGNNLRGQLPLGLGTLTSLTQLILSNNQLSGHLPACLGMLVSLENLHLDNNQFEGEIPKSLKSLEHLVVLKLEANRLTGPIPAVLGGLHRLRRLDVSNNQLSGAIPSRLTQLSLLQELLLHGNQLSGVLPEAMGQWGNLTSLQVQNNCLQGYIPASIARLTKLTGLNIQQNPDLIVDRLQLQRALPRCRIKM